MCTSKLKGSVVVCGSIVFKVCGSKFLSYV